VQKQHEEILNATSGLKNKPPVLRPTTSDSENPMTDEQKALAVLLASEDAEENNKDSS